jgi:DNA-binding NtrC family response regulator/tetratricopeptide (TPR) repeat protein
LPSSLEETIKGEAPPIRALRDQIEQLAAFDAPRNPYVPTILLRGETGTGKGLVARALHDAGPRAAAPFVDVNCAAIPESMLEAELFGFEAGAFTDARRSKPGLFEAASGGTLFLDEVDSLGPALQSKLLKAIEEKSIRRLGAIQPRLVDVKLVAATQLDLESAVADGRFRADLYHRLAVVVLAIPALRERGGDVLSLAEHFLAVFANAHGLTPRRLTGDAREWLLGHSWPGNVRELSHLMERVTLLCRELEVAAGRLVEMARPFGKPSGQTTAPTGHEVVPPTAEGLADDEPLRIREALGRSGGNVVAAARILGIGRNALRYRMRLHGIERPRLPDLATQPLEEERSATRGRRNAARRPAGAETSMAAPLWERRAVAILAIELTFSEPAGEAAREPWTAMARWRRLVQEKVGGFGGVFYHRSPSRLGALFGAPHALEQAPERAVEAALAIVNLTAGDELPPPERRVAVHLGAVRMDASTASPEATMFAVGDALALPERLLGHASPGEVLVSAPVARRIETTCALAPREVVVGGERASVWVVRGHSPGEHAGGDETPFVGRASELDELAQAFASAAARRGGVVLVSGEPGIGKSRLLREIQKRVSGQPHRWIEGRCASYGATTAFLPITDALRRLFAIDDRDDEAAAAARVREGVDRAGPAVAWTVPYLEQILSLRRSENGGAAAIDSLDSASRRSEMFRAVQALFVELARDRPLVLVIEDLHWIDPTSEELVGFLADAAPTNRFLVVLSHRPGYRPPFAARVAELRLALGPLSPGETEEMSDALLDGDALPDAVRQLIAAKADGNPFFVEELTKCLVDEGSLRREHGRFVLARDLATFDVPDTIQEVLAARIDRLAEEARRAIQVASVIGREFALRLLERIAEAGAAVRHRLDELRSLELIYEKALQPELAYMFKHALTHEVAYESVVSERRRRLHCTIGLAIEELYAERLSEHYEALAHHFGRGEDWPRALRYHRLAATKAADSYANRAVVEHCRAGLAVLDRLGDAAAPAVRHELEEALAMASFVSSEFREAAAAFERTAASNPDERAASVDLGNAALAHFWAHQYADMDRTATAALRRSEATGCAAARAFAGSILSYGEAVLHGEVAASRDVLERATREAETGDREDVLATVRFHLLLLTEWMADYTTAIAHAEQVIEVGRRLRLPHLVVWPHWFIGKSLCCLGDYGHALDRLEEALGLCERIGDRAWRGRLLNTLGWCLAEIGDAERAREANERAVAVASEIGDAEILANARINLAGNHLDLGDRPRADAELAPVEERLAQPGDPWTRWRYGMHASDVRGRIELARGEPERARAIAAQEAERAERHSAPKVVARARVLEGAALLALERPAEAEESLRRAIAVADRIAHPRIAWIAEGHLAELARRRGRSAAAERHLARRRSLIDAAAATLPSPDLRRLLG